jgi:spore coat polysaccharide biosynthesis predicted glycosyltransferase SpsG
MCGGSRPYGDAAGAAHVIAIRVSTRREAGRGHVARCEAVRGHLPLPVTWFVDPHCDVRPALRGGDLLEFEAEPSSLGALRARAATCRAAMVDSYALSDADIADLSAYIPTVAFADTPPYPAANIVVSPRLDVVPCGRVRGGAAYLPVAAAFDAWRGCAGRAPVAGTTRVLVAFGGVDSSNRTELALVALASVGPGLAITCALSPDAPHYSAVAARLARLRGAKFADPARPMAEAYAAHDMAIGAPGVSQAERAHCGLPTLLVAQNEAQAPLAAAWAARDAALFAAASVEAVAAEISALAGSPALRSAIRTAGLALVDGGGAARIAGELMTLAQGNQR